MPRARRNNRNHETPAPTPEPTTQPAEPTEWAAKAHSDGDLRIPAKLRELLKIGGHSEWVIKILEQSDDSGFVLKFTKKA